MKILLAVDDSPYSEEAVRAVSKRPWPANTRVRVLTAIEKPPPSMLDVYVAGDLEQLQLEMRKSAERTDRPFRCDSASSGLDVETVARDGDPRTVIVEEAKGWPADLVVVRSHGYTGMKRWLLGSVAHAVVQHAPCSVEVVRHRAD